MLNPNDHDTITPTGDVFGRQPEDIGFSIDIPEIDWATVVAQMSEPDTFSLSVGFQTHWCCGDPVSDPSGSGISPLWPKIPYVIAGRLAWGRETDTADGGAPLPPQRGRSSHCGRTRRIDPFLSPSAAVTRLGAL